MLSLGAHLAICHRCGSRQKNCSGSCACLRDGRDIVAHAETGDCPLGLFERPEKPGAKVVEGMTGLAKAAAGLDRADRHVIARRRLLCRSCPHAEQWLGLLQRCGLCGCVLAAKTANRDSQCPDGRW